MYFIELGSKDAPAIVFLHGTAVGGWMWKSQADRLRDFHCFLADLPGHGKSNDREWLSLEDTARQVIRLIRDRAPGKRAHLVGASLGGSVAYRVLMLAPECADHTFITGTSLFPMPGKFFFKIMLRVMAPLLKTDFFLKTALKALNFSEEDTGLFRGALQAVSARTFVNAWSQSLDLRYSPELEKVKTPVLLAAGEKEQQFIQRSNAFVAGRLPNARAFIAPGVGHGWMGESPDLFDRALRAWLTGGELPKELLPAPAG